MPSTIIGVSQTLSWSDFKRVHKTEPGEGQRGVAAHTSATWGGPAITPVPDRSTRPPTFKLQDNMTVKVSLDPNTSWVADWFLDNRSQDEKDKMLGHEQGHFNIVALLARDMFMEYRAMLDNTYKTSNALAADVQKIASRYTDTIIEVVEKLYDSRGETNHDPVNNDKAQAKWNALFSEALTSRTPLFTVMGVRGLTVPSQPQSPVTVTVPYDP